VGINPYRQNTCGSQEGNEPVQCGFESFDRMILPFNERYVVLTAGESTSPCYRHAIVSATMQFKHSVGAARARHYNSMKRGTPGKLNHRFDDALA
jgi:hypothetical protein